MGLVQVATNTVTSAVASVTLTGIDSDDVYMLVFNNFVPASDGQSPQMRVTESGTPNTTANYDVAQKRLFSNTGFLNSSATNLNQYSGFAGTGNATGENANCIMYLYNFNNASEYSFCSWEGTASSTSGNSAGRQGGGVFTSASACDGVQLFAGSGNIASGTFTLYRVV